MHFAASYGAAMQGLLRPVMPRQLTVRSAALNGTLTQGAVDACKIGCTIAIRYAADRPQVTTLACSVAGLLLAGSLNCIIWGQQEQSPWPAWGMWVREWGCIVTLLLDALAAPAALPHALVAPPSPQFGDRPILSYLTHQRRLFVGLATTYGEGCTVFAAADLLCAAAGYDSWLPTTPLSTPQQLCCLPHDRSASYPASPPACAAFHLAMLQLKQVVVKVSAESSL